MTAGYVTFSFIAYICLFVQRKHRCRIKQAHDFATAEKFLLNHERGTSVNDVELAQTLPSS
jgi:hypothetical protein